MQSLRGNLFGEIDKSLSHLQYKALSFCSSSQAYYSLRHLPVGARSHLRLNCIFFTHCKTLKAKNLKYITNLNLHEADFIYHDPAQSSKDSQKLKFVNGTENSLPEIPFLQILGFLWPGLGVMYMCSVGCNASCCKMKMRSSPLTLPHACGGWLCFFGTMGFVPGVLRSR